MSTMWSATIELWPYSCVDQGLVGPKRIRVYVAGETIKEAMASVELYRAGLLMNPCLWQAPINELKRINDADRNGVRPGESGALDGSKPGAEMLKHAVRRTMESLG